MAYAGPTRYRRYGTTALDSAFALVLCLGFVAAAPAELAVAVNLDYALLRKALVENVFTEADESLRILTDSSACNALTMAQPRFREGDDGMISVLLDVQLLGGAPVGSACLLPLRWHGQIELLEQAYLDETPGRVAFRIVDSRILDAEGSVGVPDYLWRWFKQFGQPRIESLRIDLSPHLEEADKLLAEVITNALEGHPSVFPSRLAAPVGTPQALRVDLVMDLPALPPRSEPPATPLTQAEIDAWDERWQDWDAFATWAIKLFAADAGDDLRTALMDTLINARYELRDALASTDHRADPVRELFARTWTELVPLIAAAQARHDSGTALRYVAFISAGDALKAIDAAGAPSGVRIDRNALLQVARALAPAVDPVDLEYDQAPDPDLRELLGFPPTLEPPAAGAARDWFDWVLPRAFAADPATLNGWVPSSDEIDRYLAAVDDLLAQVLIKESQRGKVPAGLMQVYASLLRATAWQESCWRQFVEQQGTVEPIRSRAGSIGMMQINQHVWRGVYDVTELGKDIGYNARAGNEILVHYLVDYALRKKEQEITGSDDNLARAAYAVYNGGPAHLRRYRLPETKKALRAIDNAFWRKYKQIKADGVRAVRQCFGE